MTPLRRIVPPDPSLCVCGIRECGIPFGYCHCGCGEKCKVARQRMIHRNLYAGFPLQYINGHNAKLPPRVDDDQEPFFLDGEPCLWLPASKGYFFIVDAGRYEELMGHRWYAHLEERSGKVYAVRHQQMVGGKRPPQVALHRHVLPPPPNKTVDHKNGNSLDNRQSNLRPATMLQQIQNRRKHKRGLKYKGVYSSRYKAGITYYGRGLCLGTYSAMENAALAYDCAARILFSEFANLNFPDITDYPDWCDGIKVKCLRALESSRPDAERCN
jgi:hypothetical protein